jgi:hypothetical protein
LATLELEAKVNPYPGIPEEEEGYRPVHHHSIFPAL